MKLNQPSDQHLEPIVPANLRCFQSKLQSLWKQCIRFMLNTLAPINQLPRRKQRGMQTVLLVSH